MEHRNENDSKWQEDPGLSGHTVGTPDLVFQLQHIQHLGSTSQSPSRNPLASQYLTPDWPFSTVIPSLYAVLAGINPLPMLGTQGTNHHSAKCNIPGLKKKKKTRKEKLKSIVLLANKENF